MTHWSNDNDGNVIHIASRRYVRFWAEEIECDFCGAPTRGRVYEDSAEVTCGACNSVIYEFPLVATLVEFTPDFEDEDGETE